MFTGIIKGLGKILRILRKRNEMLLRIQPAFTIKQYEKGESIAINGVCLTVVNFTNSWFEVFVSTETFSQTNLKNLHINDYVNLERALLIGERLGGHFVTGHVDTTVKISKIEKINSSQKIVFLVDKRYADYLVDKGSIALDGISLTINDCTAKEFSVNIIPETLRNTTISKWRLGYPANMEVDLISKHLHRFFINHLGDNNEC